MDELDRAQSLEELQLALALKQARASSTEGQPSRAQCLDCESGIPAKRRALGGVLRCAECQHDVDQLERQRGYV